MYSAISLAEDDSLALNGIVLTKQPHGY